MRSSAGTTFQIGVATSVLAVATLHANVFAPESYDLLRSSRLLWWTMVAAVLMASTYGLGLPELPARRRDAMVRSLAAIAAAVVAVSLAQLGLAVPLLPRSSLALLGLVVPLWSVIGWNIAADMRTWKTQRDRVFVVAKHSDEQASLSFELELRPESPAVVVGASSVERARLEQDGRARLVEEVERTGASVIVLDTAAQSDDGIVQQAAMLHSRGVRVRTLALFYEGWLGKLPVGELARISLLFDIGELHRQRYVRSKRVIDVGCALLGLVPLVLATPLIWLINGRANQGPLIYAQERVGRDGRSFMMYKFRTMEPRPAADGPAPWTVEDDPRITPFGQLLRRTHADELPQLLNILRGELSFVGPRPEQVQYVDELRDKIPFYDVRHLVRPGLTGWAQVKQGYAAGEADAFEKLQYDFYYLRRQGLSLDMRILWRTVRGVIGARGR